MEVHKKMLAPVMVGDTSRLSLWQAEALIKGLLRRRSLLVEQGVDAEFEDFSMACRYAVVDEIFRVRDHLMTIHSHY